MAGGRRPLSGALGLVGNGRQNLVTSGANVRDDPIDKSDESRPPDGASAMDAANSESLDSITHLVALEQEVDRLRRALAEKERALEAMTAECRRLEDRLEDQHSAYDKLKQRLDRRVQALNEAEARIQEHERALAALRAAAPSGWLFPGIDGGDGAAGPARGGVPGSLKSVAIGGLAAVLIAGVGAILWWQSGAPLREPEPPPAATAVARGEAETEPDSEAAGEAAGRPRPTVLGTVLDPLRSGQDGPLMVALRGERFTMGYDALTRGDTAPAREVALSGFLIGAHEVTFDDYDRFARATGRRLPDDFGWGRGRRPVVDVGWDDANAYAEWLSRETGERYRLPSEAEWEFAAAGGVTTPYWWGSHPETGRAVCFDCGTAWDNRSPAPVATFAANPFGLYDTAGNVAEWVADCYRPNYRGAPTDGRPWEAAGCTQRVVRGGAFSRPASSMRHFARSRLAPDTRLDMLGFRVARDP
ncbi:SUMF1/EgtB/PvdO family nonheme iron enzyme [Thiococcus pfennigii]|uniref:SUMF1/EgtB/PvdO family nonheme iron enzyme n=1 Tax=Thiococcus pfennigii TaxID=1057 RepID=UPI001902EA01|nr:SUMF1/EgtB/PvdO family nonheme iron enzyme [Thiococcus pfennigii]MBK1731432.1 hypothetical protein [Thiococcus pfennigii]